MGAAYLYLSTVISFALGNRGGGRVSVLINSDFLCSGKSGWGPCIFIDQQRFPLLWEIGVGAVYLYLSTVISCALENRGRGCVSLLINSDFLCSEKSG